MLGKVLIIKCKGKLPVVQLMVEVGQFKFILLTLVLAPPVFLLRDLQIFFIKDAFQIIAVAEFFKNNRR